MKHRTMILSATLATMSLFCLAIASAQITETKLIPDDEWDPRSLSLSGDYALVGSADVESDGSAYIFHFDGSNWVQQAKLTASDTREGDGFGSHSVSLSNDFAIIGARTDDTQGGPAAGSAYIFHFDGINWVEHTKLTASDGEPQDNFGYNVSLSGDHAFVGALGGNSTYIFHFDGTRWVEQGILFESGQVSIYGDLALKGAGHENAAYVYSYDGSTWLEQARLTPSDSAAPPPPLPHFGISVSLYGDYALIGAYNDDDNGPSSGSAYIFHFDGTDWVEQAKLVPRDGEEYTQFGSSVSLSGDYALVGAEFDDDNGNGAGAAYIFHYDGTSWVEQLKLAASDGSFGDRYGFQVSMSDNFALVGAHSGGFGNYGSVYAYSASSVCSKVSQFQARCRPGGLIKARVTMVDASHAGDIIEISIDEVPYQVVIDASGRGLLSQAGFSSGPHTVELTNPGQCFVPIVVTCRTSLDEIGNDEWDNELISETPTETALLGNYPNPFNPSTTIRYTLSVDSPVSIRVYNMLGQEVATLIDGFQKAGEQSVVWHGTNNFGQAVASGLYIYRLQTGNMIMSQKMLFAK